MLIWTIGVLFTYGLGHELNRYSDSVLGEVMDGFLVVFCWHVLIGIEIGEYIKNFRKGN